MEPITRGVRLISMDEYAEDLPGSELPAWMEQYFARERAWHRLLRGTGAVTPGEAGERLAWWTTG
ncbi:hypothetical protein AN913_11175 [Mycobacteroides immunogenum]|nr:hypothetical protein AN913_11175 [Mycobacteroides immunogenum]KPG62623.1 hypothetical protein AN918_01260 [Mycobacteroides immunogenum]